MKIQKGDRVTYKFNYYAKGKGMSPEQEEIWDKWVVEGGTVVKLEDTLARVVLPDGCNVMIVPVADLVPVN